MNALSVYCWNFHIQSSEMNVIAVFIKKIHFEYNLSIFQLLRVFNHNMIAVYLIYFLYKLLFILKNHYEIISFKFYVLDSPVELLLIVRIFIIGFLVKSQMALLFVGRRQNQKIFILSDSILNIWKFRLFGYISERIFYLHYPFIDLKFFVKVFLKRENFDFIARDELTLKSIHIAVFLLAINIFKIVSKLS